MTPRTNWHLEDRIWEAIRTKAYGGNEEEIENLKDRLTSYLLEPEDYQKVTQRGLEALGSDTELVKGVNLIVSDRLFGYIRVIENTLSKPDIDEKGLESIFTLKDSSFLKREVRDKRDDVLRYGALLHILDRSNPTVTEVVDFVKDVRLLLGIYHNLRVEHGVFASDVNYQSYTNTTQIIEQNRDDIESAKSSFSQGLVAYVRCLSYRIEAAIFFQFVNSIRISDVESQGMDLTKLESKRIELRQKLNDIRKVDSIGPQLKEFYHSDTLAVNYIKGRSI